MNELLECPQCHRHKFFLVSSQVLTSMPPIYVDVYRCAYCEKQVTTRRQDRIRKADFVKINEDTEILLGDEK